MSIRMDVTQEIGPIELCKQDNFPKVSSYYGSNTFNELTMKKVLSEKTFNAFKKWQDEGAVISEKQADEIANAMKEWAIEKGATAYTHWFQPMTGLTAEKHDGFISVNGKDQVLEKFSGSKLIQGEPDASSFPSGGIRATFEARGYTAWDPSSPAFIAEVELGKTLCIPSIFVSYTGEALDKKLPLLRSDAAISKAAMELLKIFGHTDVKNVYSTCGPEQEYFLIDESYYKLRTDLQLTGRTLFGTSSSKGQQLEDQYFGSIKERILNYMNEVAEEAYKIGIPVTTRHNEVAPHQYEFAPIFEKSNIAADHNQMLMDIMKKVAHRHQLVCLLHEKPFAGINGSGKHLNWSLADDKGNNLLNPGDTPEDNLQFLTVLVAVIQAVYQHADMLRAAVAFAGNEHRLGANEAPPAIVSVYLGEQLTKIVDAIESGTLTKSKKSDLFDLGVGLLPKFIRDQSDRNRTSPFAFTGSKFEFRALGSSMNISTAIAVVNTVVADSFDSVTAQIKAELKKTSDLKKAVFSVLGKIIKDSKNILFEGNNYAQEWLDEAKRRGLPNEPSSPEALKAFIKPANIAMFERQGVLSKVEMKSRYHIWIDTYDKVIDIEAKTLIDMANTQVLPHAYEFQADVANGLDILLDYSKDKSIKLVDGAVEDRKELFSDLSAEVYYIRKNLKELSALLRKAEGLDEIERAGLYFMEVKPVMEHIRKHIDGFEAIMPDNKWLLPKYKEMLFIC
ncbi:MAG: glutamine synthetase III [Chitinivibrionales bacterium]